MDEIQYENIGNVRKDYKHKSRIVIPNGLIVDPNLVLKMYSMLKNPDSIIADVVGEAKLHILREIGERNIEPLIGLGFAILSEDMLNVARWDIEYPIVLKNQIYGYRNEQISTAKLLDIRDIGAFCIWELGIVAHERDTWKKFLESRREETDEKQYLDSVIEGWL